VSSGPNKGTIEEKAVAVLSERESTVVHMTIDMPEEALASLRTDSEDFVRQLRVAAAVKWYELRRVSQERAAEIAGLSRVEFLVVLGQFGVSPFQYTAAEALEEAGRE
jgi:predicted HTH domain antitoxin